MNISNSIQGNSVKGANINEIKAYMPSGIYKKDVFTPSPRQNSAPAKTFTIPGQYSSKLLLNIFASPKYMAELLQDNEEVEKILTEYGISPEYHPENVIGIQNTHLQTTNIIAQQIANKLHLSPLEKQILEQGAIFHDFGKILIPKDILNKPEKLTEKEKEIMDLHARLGYELLSKTKLNKRTLELIRNHHTPQKSKDILCQILSVADIYSALREQRSYKKPLTNAQALNILDQKAQNGEVSTEVVNALKEIVRNAA